MPAVPAVGPGPRGVAADVNVLSLGFVRNPDSAVAAALKFHGPQCEEVLRHFYTAWTVVWPNPERERAAVALLEALEKRGLGHLRAGIREHAEKVREELEKANA